MSTEDMKIDDIKDLAYFLKKVSKVSHEIKETRTV